MFGGGLVSLPSLVARCVLLQRRAAEEAGRLLSDLPALWREADLEERGKLLLGMLDAVYVETKELKQVVAIQPKPAFGPVFQVATAREGSGVVLIKEPLQSSFEPGEANSCSWWRRSRDQLHLKHGLAVLVAASWIDGLGGGIVGLDLARSGPRLVGVCHPVYGRYCRTNANAAASDTTMTPQSNR